MVEQKRLLKSKLSNCTSYLEFIDHNHKNHKTMSIKRNISRFIRCSHTSLGSSICYTAEIKVVYSITSPQSSRWCLQTTTSKTQDSCHYSEEMAVTPFDGNLQPRSDWWRMKLADKWTEAVVLHLWQPRNETCSAFCEKLDFGVKYDPNCGCFSL